MINSGLFSSNTCEWATPKNFFNELNNEFHFTLDPCATELNHKCDKYYTIKENGLEQNWKGEIVFCNPPYGKEISKWVKKCYEEHKKNGITVVMLIPARTDTSYFHDYIYERLLQQNGSYGIKQFNAWNYSNEDMIKYNALVKVGLEKIEKELMIDYKKIGEDE